MPEGIFVEVIWDGGIRTVGGIDRGKTT